MSPSQFAKSIGWRSLKDCERFLGLGENSMARTAKTNPVKFRALVRGAFIEHEIRVLASQGHTLSVSVLQSAKHLGSAAVMP